MTLLCQVARDVVLPGGMINGHRAVDDVYQMAFEDAPGSPAALSWLVSGEQLLRARVEAFLDDGCGVEHAVESPVAASV